MTAEVAILNKHGVALAADSAMTVGKGKVYNTASKLYELSKNHPVGIMVYGRSEYMGIDWEIIIKEFRKTLGDKSFKTLFEYANDFTEYVEKYPFITEEMQKDTLISLCQDLISNIHGRFGIKCCSFENIEPEQASEILNSTTREILTFVENADGSARYTFDTAFLKQYQNDIYEMIDELFEEIKVSDEQKEDILKIIIFDLSKGFLSNFTGIVIAGYGDKEIFPSVYDCKISGKIGKSFILFSECKESISQECNSMINPYAQTEMVHNFVRGIDPKYKESIYHRLELFTATVLNMVGNSHENEVNKAKEELIEYLEDYERRFYVNPILDIVTSLEKLDLAEMAESLVNLTAFKRHVSKDSETVGGPTDVAVITKGDGFVWIKRKQYIDNSINR